MEFGDYYQVRDWLEGFIPFTWTKAELGLERPKYLLKLLGNPQNKFKSIHVAGTSGKGSTAFYTARLLAENFKFQIAKFSSGKANFKLKKIGLHISPHLTYLGERMQINGRPIPTNRLIRLISQIRPIVESMKNSSVGFPSYFEILVASSFLYFAQEKVDFAVVEVGLGGRLDATNVLLPEINVITNIGLDHTEILGKTIEKIAYEKAGIIKEGVPTVTGVGGKALEVIKKVARAKKAILIKIDTQTPEKSLKSDFFSSFAKPIDIVRAIAQNFVLSNAFLAIAAVGALGISLNPKVIEEAFKAGFPGRFEEIEPGVILDGAHNLDKIRTLINFIEELKVKSEKFKVDGIILVVAFKRGRDWRKMVDLLIKNLSVAKVIATKFWSVTDTGKFAAVEPGEIARYLRYKGIRFAREAGRAKGQRIKVDKVENSQEAVFEAINSAGAGVSHPGGVIVVVTGSLYLVGEVRTMWKLPEF